MSGIEFNQLLYGGDYNPEQWLEYPQILEEDIKMMQKAKINTVSLGMFSWSKLEPKEDIYDFEWLSEIIDCLYKAGIFVNLATPSGARPHWMAQKYPEILRMDEKRVRNLFGLRHNHCYTSPIYRKKVRQINTELAKRFDSHPGVILWHISNEYGGECHCPLCQEAFRTWLKERYQTIEEVNRRWSTTFWSHIYDDFSQIESPSSIGETSIHGLYLDWKRFVTDQTVDFCKEEIKALRDAGAVKPTTTNMMYNFDGLNYHKFADTVDIISWDNYPTWHKEKEKFTAMDCGMQHDIMRSIKKQPFLLMESCPSATNWQSVSKLKRPGILEASSLQAVAHGSDSVLYFQIRKGRGGFEKFHGAVIDHYGKEDDRVYQECCEVGKSLQVLSECKKSQIKSKVAVVHDWENRWAVEEAKGPRNKNIFYKETIEKSYSAFRKQGLNVDMIDMEQSLDSYQIVAAPLLYLIRADFEKKVKQFVEKGGIFILTYWSGVVDETDLCVLGGTPGGLMEVMGLRSTEIDALYDGEVNQIIPLENSIVKNSYSCEHLCQLVQLHTAKPLMTYGQDFYKGTPALTVNSYGKGSAYYICADAQQEFYDEFYCQIVKQAGIVSPFFDKLPEGIEVTTRNKDNVEYMFIQNFNSEAVELPLNLSKYEVVFGKKENIIAPFKTMVLK